MEETKADLKSLEPVEPMEIEEFKKLPIKEQKLILRRKRMQSSNQNDKVIKHLTGRIKHLIQNTRESIQMLVVLEQKAQDLLKKSKEEGEQFKKEMEETKGDLKSLEPVEPMEPMEIEEFKKLSIKEQKLILRRKRMQTSNQNDKVIECLTEHIQNTRESIQKLVMFEQKSLDLLKKAKEVSEQIKKDQEAEDEIDGESAGLEDEVDLIKFD